MRTKLIFGWHLDVPSFPEGLPLGTRAVGPRNCIAELALRLGLASPTPHQSLRIAEYMGRMQSLMEKTSPVFYGQSFTTDAWATAKAVLKLRDELVSAGWDGSVGADQAHPRLQTIAKLEVEEASSRSIFGAADLQQSVLNALINRLKSGQAAVVDEILLLDDQHLLPPVWRKILDVLGERSTKVVQFQGGAHSHSVSESDLGRLAMSLAGQNDVEASFRGDGSLTVAQAEDEVQAADFLAALLSALPDESDSSTVIIRGAGTHLVDAMLSKQKLPRLGGAGSSPARSFLQLIPLAFELCWQPVNPQLLIELLTLPCSPVPRSIGNLFLHAIRQEYGTGGECWLEAWRQAFQRQTEYVENGQAARDDGEMVPNSVALEAAAMVSSAVQRWRAWLDGRRFDPGSGIPASEAAQVCDRLKEHATAFASKCNDREGEVFTKALSYIQVLSSIIAVDSGAVYPRAQLNRIVQSVISDGCRVDAAEVSNWVSVDHPGQIFAPADLVVWWGFFDPELKRSSSWWSAAESNCLNDNGIYLEGPADSMRREAAAFRRPLNSRKLILIKPQSTGGKTIGVHPFFHEITESLKKAESFQPDKLYFRVDEMYKREHIQIAHLNLGRHAVSPAQLPVAEGTWQLGRLELPQLVQSATSLERLAGCPLSWTLKYAARIRRSFAWNAPNGELIAGNLAHAVLSAFFNQQPEWSTLTQDELARIGGDLFDSLCPQLAANFLLPGKSFERQRLRKLICEALISLCGVAGSAGFDKARASLDVTGSIDDVNVTGQLDLLLSGSVGEFIIDFKWTGHGAHRRQEIADGNAVQLAVYSGLGERRDGAPPIGAGYYLLAQKQLYSPAPGPFPRHTMVSGPSLDRTLRAALSTYKKTIGSIRQGNLRVSGVQSVAIGGQRASTPAVPQPANAHDEVFALSIEAPCATCEFSNICSVGRPQ